MREIESRTMGRMVGDKKNKGGEEITRYLFDPISILLLLHILSIKSYKLQKKFYYPRIL